MKRSFVLPFLWFVLVPTAIMAMTAAPGIDDSRRNAITRAVETVSPAVVGINVTEVREYQQRDPFWRFFYGDRVFTEQVQSLGSGWILSSDGYILTNFHVAGNASKIVVTMSNGKKYSARLIGADQVTDIALLKIDSEKEEFPFLRFGNSDDVIVGEWSIAFGNPFGLFSANAKPTVTVGVVSAVHMYLDQQDGTVFRDMIQTDAAINSGNSGGPLVNGNGEVIGMNTVIYSPNQGSVGLGFAIPANKVRTIADLLKKNGKVDRSFSPGFRVQLVNAAIARAYGLSAIEGVIVTDVARTGAAMKSGLEVADVILQANGEPVMTIQSLESLIRASLKGDVIVLDILRNGNRMKLELHLN